MLTLNIGNVNGGLGGTAGSSHTGFIVLLYVLAFACFTAAGFVLFLGIRKLLAVGRY
jgi:hypothetical protein